MSSAHPLQTSIDIASLCPNARDHGVITWKEPPELKARTINRVRTFLKARSDMLRRDMQLAAAGSTPRALG